MSQNIHSQIQGDRRKRPLSFGLLRLGAVLLAASCMLASGCSIIHRDKTDIMSPINPMSFRNKPEAGSIFAQFKQDMNDVSDYEKSYFGGADHKELPEPQRRRLRNHIAQLLLDDFNLCWFNFSSSFQGRYGLFKATADSTAGGLAAFAAVTPTQQTAKLMAAGAATIIGLNSAVQKDFFEGNAAYILLGQMDADRQQILAAIRSSLTKSDDDYPLNLLMIDLWNYVNVMTVPHALTALNGKVGQQASQTQNSSYGLRQPAIRINGVTSPLTHTSGTAKQLIVSGGAGMGSFEWNCVEKSGQAEPKTKGSGISFDLSSLKPGEYTVSVYKAGDSIYSQSESVSIDVKVKAAEKPPSDSAPNP